MWSRSEELQSASRSLNMSAAILGAQSALSTLFEAMEPGPVPSNIKLGHVVMFAGTAALAGFAERFSRQAKQAEVMELNADE